MKTKHTIPFLDRAVLPVRRISRCQLVFAARSISPRSHFGGRRALAHPECFRGNATPEGGYPGENTAAGGKALQNLDTINGISNTAVGYRSLFENIKGDNNTAIGAFSLRLTTGIANTACGSSALRNNTTGNANTALGFNALFANTAGINNTAIGISALGNTTGSNNIALGVNAGINLTDGNQNIVIGHAGVAGDANKIRVGTQGIHTDTRIAGIHGRVIANAQHVVVSASGRLGTVASSARFKQAVKPMDKASEALLQLEPVTFRYKDEVDSEGHPQFGLIAEQVEKIDPTLVARDEEGKVFSVRYDAVNAMLLNEFLKEHRKVRRLELTVAQQEKASAHQENQIKALEAGLKKQAAEMRKVSAQMQLGQSAPRLTVNGQ